MEAKRQLSERKIYIQIIGVISAMAVVLMHANEGFWTFSYEAHWIGADIIENLAYFAVPVFFMISGVTLLDYRKRYSSREYLKKRVIKTVIPFAVWSVIGMIVCFTVGGWTFEGVLPALSALLSTQYVRVYWFFPALFCVYMGIPVFGLIPEEKRKKCFGYIILCTVLINSAGPLFEQLSGFYYSDIIYFPVAVGYCSYALIGYWIDNYELKKWQRLVIYILAAVSLAVMIVGTLIRSYAAGEVDTIFKEYVNLPAILYSTGIFTFFKYIRKEKVLSFLGKITAPFAPLTFGIYLVHWYILQAIAKFSPVRSDGVLYKAAAAILAFFLSALIVWILRKIPVVKKIVP